MYIIDWSWHYHRKNKMINLQLYLIHYNNGAICTPCVLTRRLDSNVVAHAGVFVGGAQGGWNVWIDWLEESNMLVLCAKLQGTKRRQMCAWVATTEMWGKHGDDQSRESIINAQQNWRLPTGMDGLGQRSWLMRSRDLLLPARGRGSKSVRRASLI